MKWTFESTVKRSLFLAVSLRTFLCKNSSQHKHHTFTANEQSSPVTVSFVHQRNQQALQNNITTLNWKLLFTRLPLPCIPYVCFALSQMLSSCRATAQAFKDIYLHDSPLDSFPHFFPATFLHHRPFGCEPTGLARAEGGSSFKCNN